MSDKELTPKVTAARLTKAERYYILESKILYSVSLGKMLSSLQKKKLILYSPVRDYYKSYVYVSKTTLGIEVKAVIEKQS